MPESYVNRRPGTFFAVVGPSGAGKDSLLRFAESAVAGAVFFPRRVVTRPANPTSEDHDVLTPAQFDAVRAAGEFALSWQAHGLSYGVPKSVDDAITRGVCVACNISRAAIDQAGARYSNVEVVLITAPADVLARRLAARGREKGASIERRLARGYYALPEGHEVHCIENAGALEAAGSALVELLMNGAVGRGLQRERQTNRGQRAGTN